MFNFSAPTLENLLEKREKEAYSLSELSKQMLPHLKRTHNRILWETLNNSKTNKEKEEGMRTVKTLRQKIKDIESEKQYTEFLLDHMKFTMAFTEAMSKESIVDKILSIASAIDHPYAEMKERLEKNSPSSLKMVLEDISQKFYLKLTKDPRAGLEMAKNVYVCDDCSVTLVYNATENHYSCPKCALVTSDYAPDADNPETSHSGTTVDENGNKKNNGRSKSRNRRDSKQENFLRELKALEASPSDIPDFVKERFRRQLKEEGNRDPSTILFKDISNYLTQFQQEAKRLKRDKEENYSLYYRLSLAIYKWLTGKGPEPLTYEMKEQLCAMNRTVMEEFDAFANNDVAFGKRKNELNVRYKLRQLLRIKDLGEYIPYVRQFKTKNSLNSHNEAFEAICRKMGWKFVPESFL